MTMTIKAMAGGQASPRNRDDVLARVVGDVELLPDAMLSQPRSRVRIDPRLLQLYVDYRWDQRARMARTWLTWTGTFNLLLVPCDALMAPSLLVPSLLIRGFGMTLLFGLLFLGWRRKIGLAFEGATFVLVTIGLMIGSGSLGVFGGPAIFEHYLLAGLFTTSTAIFSFQVSGRWVVAGIVSAIAIHLLFLLLFLEPASDLAVAIPMMAFYCAALFVLAHARFRATDAQWRRFMMDVRQRRTELEMARLNEELRLAADIDLLTGVANRRRVMRHIEAIWNDAPLVHGGVCFLMIDIDRFKCLNDTSGHAAGDDCIHRVAGAIAGAIRPDLDMVARYGGEEFLVVMTWVNPSVARATALRIRQGIEALAIPNPGSEADGFVTVSIGVAFAGDGRSPERVSGEADAQLYRAKRMGRNRVCGEGWDESEPLDEAFCQQA